MARNDRNEIGCLGNKLCRFPTTGEIFISSFFQCLG